MDISRRPKLSHQSKSFVRTRRTHLFVICGIVLVLICGLLFGVSKIVGLQAFHIDTVQIFGADEDIVPVLSKVADQALGSSYMGLFSRRSSLIYPAGSLISAMQSASPRVGQAAVRRDGWHSLIISISQKVPAALVCTTLPDWNGDTLSVDDSDNCYVSDETGYMFEQAPSFSGHIYNRYYAPDILTATSSADNSVGVMATSTGEFMALQHFYTAVKAAGIDVQALLIKPGGEYELYANQKTSSKIGSTSSNNTLVIYFNNTRSFDIQLSNLTSFWERMSADMAAGKGPASKFEYIDIRYGSNVFYRLIK